MESVCYSYKGFPGASRSLTNLFFARPAVGDVGFVPVSAESAPVELQDESAVGMNLVVGPQPETRTRQTEEKHEQVNGKNCFVLFEGVRSCLTSLGVSTKLRRAQAGAEPVCTCVRTLGGGRGDAVRTTKGTELAEFGQ